MNTELLREDERRWYSDSLSFTGENGHGAKFAQRLIEEREGNAELQHQLKLQQAECHTVRRAYLHEKWCKEKAEAELAEARRICKNHNDDRECFCPYCCVFKPAAIKEGK